jgi:hypothetical protein
MEKEPTNKELMQAIDNLAAMTARGFESVDKRFEAVEGRIINIENTMVTKEDLKDLEVKTNSDYEPRLRTVEDNIRVIKNSFEKDLKIKLAN